MEIKTEKNIVIANPGSRNFIADAVYPDIDQPTPLVIFCHGYKCFKDWGAWQLVAESFAKAGFYFVKFNFSHNGTSIENPLDFVDLESFGNNNFSKEANDIDKVIGFFSAKKPVDQNRIAIIGHSRGGGISLIKAYEDDRIKALITWAGVSNFKYRFPHGENFDTWKQEGVFFSQNSRTKQQMPHYFQFYEDFEANAERFDIQYAAQHFTKPFLIVHGTEDETIKEKEPQLLHEWAKISEIVYIEGATHTFGAKHPWNQTTLPKELERVVKTSIDFLKENLH